MTKLMIKKIQILTGLIIIFSFSNCDNDAEFNKTKTNFVKFKNDFKISNNKGIPTDSTVNYILKDAFDNDFKKEENSISKFTSFGLFKMKEPILYNYSLNKEIYRLIIDRAFDPILIIKIEKIDNKKILLSIKKLNRPILFPFLRQGLSTDEVRVRIIDPITKKEIRDSIQDRKNDSLAISLNNTNYYPIIDYTRDFTEQEWNNFKTQLIKSKFWSTNPLIILDDGSTDGSCWILEGHDKNGYQIKALRNPFSSSNSKEISDLFEFILNFGRKNLVNERFY